MTVKVKFSFCDLFIFQIQWNYTSLRGCIVLRDGPLFFWQEWGSLKQIVWGGCKHWKNATEKLKCLQENGDTHKKIVCSRSRIHIKKNIFACENFPLSPSPPSKSNGPSPQIKDEAARRPKTSHFAILPSLIWRGGGEVLAFHLPCPRF